MRTYTGSAKKFYCSNVEELEYAIENQIWFRTNSSNIGNNCYYKAEPYKTSKWLKYESEKMIFAGQSLNITDLGGKHFSFYEVVTDENPKHKIYSGNALKNLILREIYTWAIEMNLDTMRAFQNRKLANYLSTIPHEIYIENYDDMKKSFEKGVHARATDKKTDLEKLASCHAKADVLFDKILQLNKSLREIDSSLYRQKKEKIEKIKEN